MSTKTISFRATEDQIHLIDRLVEDGDYTSRGELIRSLLRKIEEKELSDRAKKDIEEARKQKGRPLDDLF
ncbi:MAG: ribbon-helix-helix domain-containing protein [Candidatus Thermoplasmatota archaeon]|jgi:Arc/MetJ-type ribon-helix-helix transcriptional regulator|nr:ribbon-helix-helix domain-containing protein [Candidatus Thermoplasmatota archaeon]MDP7264220.1 ribbon-helix-helix domain-containing protein [Candidatus Thermoplasmatota archaeon]